MCTSVNIYSNKYGLKTPQTGGEGGGVKMHFCHRSPGFLDDYIK
jgi:hypothetical protein